METTKNLTNLSSLPKTVDIPVSVPSTSPQSSSLFKSFSTTFVVKLISFYMRRVVFVREAFKGKETFSLTINFNVKLRLTQKMVLFSYFRRSNIKEITISFSQLSDK